MTRFTMVLCALSLLTLFGACDDGESGMAVTNAEFQQACQNGVLLCEGDPTYGVMFGSQDCSTAAIDEAYAICDAGCRANAAPIIDCQIAASSCEAFAGCVM